MPRKSMPNEKTLMAEESEDEEDPLLESKNNKAFLIQFKQDELTAGILRGEPEAALKAERKAVRLFVASTFTDAKKERNYITREVFPCIRQLCHNHGVEFSVVDLNWGIRDYPENHHTIPEIAQHEIQRCIQSTIPGAPCFIYFAFNSYGCTPVPRLVPAREIEAIVSELEDEDMTQLVGTWYKKDWNARPPVYVLQPISTFFPLYGAKEVDKKKMARNEWYKISETVMRALSEIAMDNPAITPEQQERWLHSATHNEVLNGLLDCEEGAKRGFCYARDIVQFSDMKRIDERLGDKVWRYIDTDQDEENVDKQAQTVQIELRQQVKDHGVPMRLYTVSWAKKGIDEENHIDYMKQLANDVKTDLTERISQALKNLPTLDSCAAEIVSHVAFCHKRSTAFHGRAELVDKAMKYFEPTSNQQNRNMQILFGISGSGKTSLMSKLISMARETITDEHVVPIVVTRFCGISQFSSSARALMTSMCQQIATAFQEEVTIPINFASLKHTFEQMLRKATFCNPLLVFINCLNHLSDEDNGRADLGWLPTVLPPFVYMVVSTSVEKGGCFGALKMKELPEEAFIEVGPLNKEDASAILKGWLDEAGRKLSLAQFNHVNHVALDSSKEQPNVLRLKLLFDVAVRWTSYDPLPQFSNTTPGLITEFFTHIERLHGKPLITALCGLLGASMHGLPENDIIDIISTDDTLLDTILGHNNPPVRRLPRVMFLRLKWDLKNYLVERFDYGKTVLYWYHRQFWLSATRRYLTGETSEGIDKKTGYSKFIAEYYSDVAQGKYQNKLLTPQPLYWVNSQGETIFNLTKLTELPNSIAQCPPDTVEMLNSRCLCNLGFIAAKCAAGLSKELISDFNKAISRIKNKRLRTYNIFLMKNINILEKDPSLALQQMMNMPDNLTELHRDIQGKKPRDITPWISSDKMCYRVHLVNKPIGIHPCNITIQASDSLPGRTFTDVRTIEVGHRSYFVVCSTIWGWADKLDIYDRYTGKLALRVDGHKVRKTGGTIREVRLYKDKDSVFHIICRNYDDVLLKIVTVSVGETLMGFLGGVIDGDWISKDKGEFDQAHFEMTHDMSRIVTYVMKREEVTEDGEGDNDGYRTILAVWDVKKCVEKKSEEVCRTPLVFKIGSEKFTLSKKPGYGICSIAFSPDDKYIVLSLTRPVETGNPISIVDSKTLAPLWLWYGYGRFQCSYIHTYPCRLAPRTWYLVMTGSSYRGNKYGIAVHTTKSGHLVSKNLWKGMGDEVNAVSTFPKGEETQFVFHMNDTIRLLDIPTVNVSDYKTWKAPSPEGENTEYENTLEGGLEFTDFDTTIVSLSMGENSDCCTLSKSGEVKLCDLSLCAEYKAPDKLPSAIIASCLSPDKSLVYTNSPHGVCAWDSRTGKAGGQFKIRGSMSVLKPGTNTTAVTSIYKGTSVIVASDGQVFSLCEDNFLVYLTADKVKQSTGEKWNETEDLNYQGFYEFQVANDKTERTEACVHAVPNYQMSLSPDGCWLTISMRYSKKLHLCLMNVKTKETFHKLVHDHPQITDGLFESLYNGTFSNNGRYLAAWGSMHIVYTKVRSDHGCTADIWPPLIKLFEFGGDGSLREISQTQSEGHRPSYRPGEVLRRQSTMVDVSEMVYKTADLTGLIFLPGDKYIVTSTKEGYVEIREVPKLVVAYKLQVHEETVTSITAVKYKDDTFLITGSSDKWIYVYKLAQTKQDLRVRLNSKSALPNPTNDSLTPPRTNNYVESETENNVIHNNIENNTTNNKKLKSVAIAKSAMKNGKKAIKEPVAEKRPDSTGPEPEPIRPRSGTGVRLDPIPNKRPFKICLQQVAKYHNGREVTCVTAFVDTQASKGVMFVQICDTAGRVNIVSISLE